MVHSDQSMLIINFYPKLIIVFQHWLLDSWIVTISDDSHCLFQLKNQIDQLLPPSSHSQTAGHLPLPPAFDSNSDAY